MNADKTTRRPLIDPLLLLMKSRRVLIALCALLVGVLLLAVPELAPLRAEITTLVITLALALIAGYSLEDAVRAGRERAAQPDNDLRELLREMIDSLLDPMVGESTSDQSKM